MKLKRTIWAFMACCMTVWSCMKEDIVLPEAGHTGEISFSLDYRGYEGIRETKSTAAAEYTARWGEPEWGCVFRELSRREERHCLLLAQMMGN